MDLDTGQVNQMVQAFFPGIVGLEFSRVEPGLSECHLDVHPRHHNPMGILHGAVPYALADTGMAIALMATLREGEHAATVEIKISYYRPVSDGRLTCTTRVTKRGNRIAFLESEVRDEKDTMAKANGTYYITQART